MDYSSYEGHSRAASQSSPATAVFFVTMLVFSAAWMTLVAGWFLVRVTPAVLPGTTFSVPLLTATLEHLPGDFAVSHPNQDHPFNRPITVLLMGVDQRPGESELSVRTDSIAVVRLDPVTHRVTVLSVPRDLWVVVHPSDGDAYWERINASYQEGALTGGSVGAGAKQLARDLEANFGLQTDHWVWLGMANTRQLIDAAGGVDVVIPESLAVPEWRYTEDDVTNPRTLRFEPGAQHLSGYEAVAFSRYRGDSDLYRAQRQQLVLRALLADPFSLRLLLNPFPAVTASKSNLSVPRLAGLALLATRSSDNTQLYSLGEEVNGTPTVIPIVTDGGASVLDWNADNVAYWVEQASSTR